MPKISTGSARKGSPNTGGVGSNGDFRPISCYISDMVQDRDIVKYASICIARFTAKRLKCSQTWITQYSYYT